MKRKVISTTLALVGIVIIGFSILYFLGLFKEQNAGIFIQSDPIAKVFIDGKEVGNTPYEASLNPGEINVRIKPIQDGTSILDDYETKINLVPGIKTIIKRTFKPSNEDSIGAVVSFEKVGGEESYVTVVSVPDNSQVIIDDKLYGNTPIRVAVPAGDHNLIVKSNNYIEESLPIRVYKGYKLTASVKLAADVNDVVATPTPEAIESLETESITINPTDIGFLRVREGAGVNYAQIGMVKPGEVYEILDTDATATWYQIEFGDPKVRGWVSKEFVKKN